MPGIIFLLILLMIIGAAVAIETPNLLHSVISLGAVGFLLAIVFLFLSAPDLAITQIAVEVVTLVLLLQAIIRSTENSNSNERPRVGKLVGFVIVLILAAVSVRILADFPEFGQPVTDRFADAPSNTYLSEGLEKTGAANIVTAVLLDFRAYDTLGEVAILFCAVTGGLSVLRRRARKQPEQPDEEEST